MFKFGKKKPPTLDDNEPEPVMRSKSNSFSLVSPRPHHSIQFGQRRASAKLPDTEQLKFGKKTLPPDFAEKLLELEIDIDINENVPIETFQELVQTYMVGVEYYESIKDRKHLYFQRKLNALMTKPAFLMSSNKAIEKMEEKENPKELLNQVDQKKKEFQDQQKKLQLELIYGQNESKEAQVNELVESHSQNMKRMDNIIQKDILTQEDTIKKRLEKRKNTSGLMRASSLPRLSVEESVIQEAQQILEQQKQDESALNPEEEKLSPTKKCDSPIDAISEEEDEGEVSRKVSMKVKKSSISREVIVTNPKLGKRQSCYLALDLIGELLKSQQSNKKKRSKSSTASDQSQLSNEEKEAIKISLQEAFQSQLQIVNENKQLQVNKLKKSLRLQ